MQRISLSQIQHEKIVELETQSLHDTLEIRFFEETSPTDDVKNKKNIMGNPDGKSVKNIRLIGSCFWNLSSIYYDETKFSYKKFNLSKVHESLGG
jgi:hypothetical protein